MSSLTDFQANSWLSEIQSVWLGLHGSNPDINGPNASEISGGGYERINVNFTDPDQRIMWNKQEARFRGMPSSTVAFLSGWNQQFNGRMIWYTVADDPERVQSGQSYVVKAGTVAVSLA